MALIGALVLEYLEFTQLSNRPCWHYGSQDGFRVPGIYTALKRRVCRVAKAAGFRVPGIYTALKLRHAGRLIVLGFRVPGIYTALKPGREYRRGKYKF